MAWTKTQKILWIRFILRWRGVTQIETRNDLTTPGKKLKLQFPTALREQYIYECGFTLEEKEIFRLRSDGLSLLQIADRQCCSVETVNRRIRSIKNKIAESITAGE
jgi:DNA-binding NarL/FixJ family response regulator